MTPHPLPPEVQRTLRNARKLLLQAMPLIRVPALRDAVADLLVTGDWLNYPNLYQEVHLAGASSECDKATEYVCFWGCEVSRHPTSWANFSNRMKSANRMLSKELKSHEQNS